MDSGGPDLSGAPPRRIAPNLRWGYLAGALAAAVVVFVTFVVPLPAFFAYLPGPVRDVSRLVLVEDARTYSSEGKLLLTTVSVDVEVTLAEAIAVALDPNKDLVDKDQVTGGRPLPQLREAQIAEMRASKQAAREVALAALGLGAPTGDGARVEGTIAGSPAHGSLRPGDVIVGIDGTAVQTTCDVGKSMAAHAPGDRVTVRVRRGEAERTIELEAAVNPADGSSAFLGVQMSDVERRFDPGLRVRFRTGDIAGPSAGLMFSLALYDRLTPDDLTGGRVIAGTGTIGCDGEVGAIGGIEEKVAAAEYHDAEIFLAPAANAAAARAAAGNIEIVSIKSFSEAVAYLEALD